MKYILIGISMLFAYFAITLFIARFCGLNSSLEKELHNDDRSDSN
jgi:hypothetical protein